MNNTLHFAILGFGEVGQILAADLLAVGAQPVGLYDPKFADPDSGPSRAVAAPLCAASTAANAVRGAQLVFSAVTAANDLAAAESVAGGLEPGAFFLDMNSVSPGAKRQAAAVVQAAGGRYVEAAVMTPFPPRRLKSPLLLGGPDAEAFLEIAGALGFNAKVYSDQIGRASAVKMCRSVMIKGMEALFSESLLAARRLGVEQDVLASLTDLLPIDVEKLAHYMISRTLLHGKRRAEEMREVAHTVEEAHITPWMASATVERQDFAWPLAEGIDLNGSLTEMLDAVLAKLPA